MLQWSAQMHRANSGTGHASLRSHRPARSRRYSIPHSLILPAISGVISVPLVPECHFEAAVSGMTGQVPDILSQEGFPAREQDERDAHTGEVVDDPQRFVGGEFSLCCTSRSRCIVAVGAAQVAAIRQVPEDHRAVHSRECKPGTGHISLRFVAVPDDRTHGSPPVQALGDPVHGRSPPFFCILTFGTRLNSRVLKRTA